MLSPEAIELYELLHGYQITQAISVAAKLKLADLLLDSPKTCHQIAKLSNLNEDALYRLLRALASVGIFKEINIGEFALTPKAKLLASTAKNTLNSFAIRCGEESYLAWSRLIDGVASNKIPFVECFHKEYFSYLEENITASEMFNQSMIEHTKNDVINILNNYDFDLFDSVMDIGGGYGQLLHAILEKYPRIHGMLFDQSEVINAAKKTLNTPINKYTYIEGDFRHAVPSGGDLYVLKHILHDWNDEIALLILTNCRKAISTKGRLLIIETIIPSGNASHSSKWQDLHMFVLFGGRERTKLQLNELLNKSGFNISKIIPLPRSGLSELSLIEAIPISLSDI